MINAKENRLERELESIRHRLENYETLLECSYEGGYKEIKFINSYFKKTKYSKITPILIALHIHETGHWRDENCPEHKKKFNLWSFHMTQKEAKEKGINPNSIDILKEFKSIEECCIWMEKYLERKGYCKDDPYLFLYQLKAKGYAEDKKHVDKIIQILNSSVKKRYCGNI